ncbi:MAG: hypothetical protein OXG92_12445 [Chloroflexi bacterium]|nr:hypothetical protein [Chloroflexota bacterium]MCY3717264.1 hypothetical protein [Chloroflexota bacterium]MDE2650320.1 hypothetical protein [Chloroflexota bacterium]MXX50908.1 hypothetical protein [Chloroflexota bacterium]MXX84376.1 hypothetical protein [Chloroflexota bacterium]
MSKALCLKGIIRHIEYDPQVRTKPLERFALDGLDINAADVAGIIEIADDVSFGYAKRQAYHPRVKERYQKQNAELGRYSGRLV